MEVLYPDCAGLDVHKDVVVACVRHMMGGKVERELRTFKTVTSGLLALSEWLASQGCTHIANFPLLANNENARMCMRTIAVWRLPVERRPPGG